jgi:hypothetical protein
VADQNPERRNLPAKIENASVKDEVDAEFTDADIDRQIEGPDLGALLEAADRAAGYQQRPRSRVGLPWIGMVLALLAGAFIYGAFFHANPTPETARPPPAVGWDDLSSCSITSSFDGRRRMILEDDQSAELREPSQSEQDEKEGNEHVSMGRWSYDAASKQYAITVNGETTNYSLLSHGSIETTSRLVGGSHNERASLEENPCCLRPPGQRAKPN